MDIRKEKLVITISFSFFYFRKTISILLCFTNKNNNYALSFRRRTEFSHQ